MSNEITDKTEKTKPQQVAEISTPENNTFPAIPTFKVQKIYIKSSFVEQPNSPQIFAVANVPKTNLELDINTETIEQGLYEVSLTVTVTAKIETQVAYIVNIKQSGLFRFENVSPEVADELLNINCPALLMTPIKNNISELIVRTGFNSFTINDFDFKAIYAQKKFYLEMQNKMAKKK